MKFIKTLILFTVLLLSFNTVKADVMPYYTSSLSKNTIGFVQVPEEFNVHLYPREDSIVIENIRWNDVEVNYIRSNAEPKDLFAVFKPSISMAYCMVIDEQDNWYQIVYNKLEHKTGWIKPQNSDDFISLKNFVSTYGKTYGLSYMKNVDYHKRGLHSGAYQESQKIGGFTMIKNIKLNKVSGNWALVTVTDFDNKPKIGYIRWREDSGSILVFPKL